MLMNLVHIICQVAKLEIQYLESNKVVVNQYEILWPSKALTNSLALTFLS